MNLKCGRLSYPSSSLADAPVQSTHDGQNLLSLSEAERRALRGGRIAYVAQSAAASFNPAHRLLDQTIEATLRSTDSSAADAHKDVVQLYDTLLNTFLLIFQFLHVSISFSLCARLIKRWTCNSVTCQTSSIYSQIRNTALNSWQTAKGQTAQI